MSFYRLASSISMLKYCKSIKFDEKSTFNEPIRQEKRLQCCRSDSKVIRHHKIHFVRNFGDHRNSELGARSKFLYFLKYCTWSDQLYFARLLAENRSQCIVNDRNINVSPGVIISVEKKSRHCPHTLQSMIFAKILYVQYFRIYNILDNFRQ